MAVTAYNDWLSDLLRNVECVLAFDTAADFLGLTDGGYRSLVQIFVDKRQKIEGTEASGRTDFVNHIFHM